jgi:AcrR family transcriptional regulator
VPPTQTALAADRPARKGERTAERILDTAERLFAEHGFAGTHLRDVASAAGLRIPSLYNHFAGKEALYAAVLERGIAPVLEALSDYVRDPEIERSRFVERVLAVLAQRPNLARLVMHETLGGGEHLSPLLRAWFKPAFEKAEEIIRATPGARRWSDEQIPLLVAALYQVAVGYFALAPLFRALDRGDLLTPEALARQTRFFGDLVAVLLPDE